MRSLIRLQSADNGFHADHVLTMRVPIGTLCSRAPPGNTARCRRQIEFYREVLDRISAVPGVRAAAVVNNLPLSEANTTIEPRPPTVGSLTYGLEPSARSISP